MVQVNLRSPITNKTFKIIVKEDQKLFDAVEDFFHISSNRFLLIQDGLLLLIALYD